MPDGTSNSIVIGEISRRGVVNTEPIATAYTVAPSGTGADSAVGNLKPWYVGSQIAVNTATPSAITGVTRVWGTKLLLTFKLNDSPYAYHDGKLLNRKGGPNSSDTKTPCDMNVPVGLGSWGSNHTNAVVFGLGDGSVRTVSDSVDDGLMFRFANVSDGLAVTLP